MHNYNVSLHWIEGRKGEITSPELNDKIQIATPPEFDKGIAGIWSPEHLFTASVLSCYMTTFLAIADFSKFNFESFDCKAVGVLDKVEGKFLMTEITLLPTLVIANESEREKAARLLAKAEAACLISNSIKTTVQLQPEVLVMQKVG